MGMPSTGVPNPPVGAPPPPRFGAGTRRRRRFPRAEPFERLELTRGAGVRGGVRERAGMGSGANHLTPDELRYFSQLHGGDDEVDDAAALVHPLLVRAVAELLEDHRHKQVGEEKDGDDDKGEEVRHRREVAFAAR